MKNKLVKYTVSGRRQGYIDLYRTFWGRVWYNIKLWTKITMIVAFFLGLMWGAFKTGSATTKVQFVQAADRSNEMFQSKIEKLKDEVVEAIAQCESKNAPQDTAIVEYDNNSKGTLTGKHIASIGVMQFKVGTVQDFHKTLHKKTLTNYEATLLALDNKRAKQLAREAIFGIQGALWHWSCATPEMGAKVTMIKNLEK